MLPDWEIWLDINVYPTIHLLDDQISEQVTVTIPGGKVILLFRQNTVKLQVKIISAS